jgi:intracellular multiplication protein IcmE
MSNFLSRIKGAASGGASKRLLIVAGAVVIAGVSFVFFRPAELQTSNVQIQMQPGGRDTVQGEQPVTPEMKTALGTADKVRIEEAEVKGTSAMPTITIDKNQTLDLDPLLIQQPELAIPEKPAIPLIERPTVLPPTVPVVPRAVAMETPVDDGRFESLRGRMEALAAPTWAAAKVDRFGTEEAPQAAPDASDRNGSSLAVGTASNIQLPSPGTILYARMMTEASSDAPGPILVEIAQGPLRGAKLLGTFSATRNKLILQFSSLTMEREAFGESKSETVSVNAVAVDPKTVGAGVASSVDYHLLENVGIGFAAAFAQGFGQAIAQSGQEVNIADGALAITNPALSTEKQLYIAGGAAAASAGQSLSSLFGNRAPTVKVKAGTPVGVFFLSRGQ